MIATVRRHPPALLAVATTVLLVATAARYGYHRDELYFLAAGRHLAWGYADQGPLTPLLARVMDELAPGSLTVLRLPAALAGGAIVLLTGLLARELGGTRRAEALAAGCAATGVIVLFDGHLLSTSTPDLLVWTTVCWLVVRAVRTGADRPWLVAGLVLGLGLLNKPLPAFLAAALLAGLLLAGPRRLLRSPYVWGGAAIAALLWLPFLLWQARHGWPQLDVSRSIAAGGSTSSQPWWLVVPFQLLLIGPLVAPVWIVGLVRLFRERALRFLAWAWVVLAVVFMVTGGKPYYLAGLLPLLVGAGAAPVERWLGRRRARWAGAYAVLAVSAVAGVVIALPVLPAGRAGGVVALNPDVSETIGWPDLVRTVAGVARDRHAVVLADNYGEAGAIDRFGGRYGLPGAVSGHNAYGYWGPPPAADDRAPVVAVGLDPDQRDRLLTGCRVVAHVRNRAGVDNDENGAPVALCRGPRRPWAAQWPSVRHLG